MDRDGLRVNARRLQRSLESLARIGATADGGVDRLALTDADRQARDALVAWLDRLGLRITIDDMGNIFGLRAGRDEGVRPVMMGSHLDSQSRGGRFDGALGVMGALEVMRVLEESRVVTERPVILAAWTAEEGSRFTPSKLGSAVWAGDLDKEWVWGRPDRHGATLLEELERIGYKGVSPCAHWPFQAYYELHIEQGPLLEAAGRAIGVPAGIVSLHVYDVHVSGEANQVGPTPMEGRRDALVAAAEMVLAVRALPSAAGGDMVATVGMLEVAPNCYNVIPEDVHFTVDLRGWDEALVERSWERLAGEFRGVAARHGCRLHAEESSRTGRTEFDPGLMRRITDHAEALGLSTMSLVSGAGHDTAHLAGVGPTAMIFVPSIGGRSHTPAEETGWADCAAGADVLLRCILEASGTSSD